MPAKLTQERLARDLSTTQQNVSNWQTGRFRPGPLMRAKIERLYAIPQDAWLSADERESLAATLPAIGVVQPLRAVGGAR